VVVGIALARAVIALTPLSPATGTLQAVDSHGDVVPRFLSGTVPAETSGSGFMIFPVGTDGRFTVHPVIGTYTVSGLSPQFERDKAEGHAIEPVTVTKGVTSRVTVDCQER
jgi:hypothetical protein